MSLHNSSLDVPLIAPECWMYMCRMLDVHVHNADFVKAEISWILKFICSGYSNTSCEQLNSTLKAMFPDSKITEVFSIGILLVMLFHPFLSLFCYLS